MPSYGDSGNVPIITCRTCDRTLLVQRLVDAVREWGWELAETNEVREWGWRINEQTSKLTGQCAACKSKEQE